MITYIHLLFFVNNRQQTFLIDSQVHSFQIPDFFQQGRELSYKIFSVWILISIYQGGIIMYGALMLFEGEFLHIVAISYTSLVITELLMVALTIRTWHWLMFIAEFLSIIVYIASMFIFKSYFGEFCYQKIQIPLNFFFKLF